MNSFELILTVSVVVLADSFIPNDLCDIIVLYRRYIDERDSFVYE